jgi:hypothetical protein
VTEALADIIHIRQCADAEACVRYNRGRGDPHHDWYVARAAAIMDELEPQIGGANVLPCVRTVLDELAVG